MLTRLLLPLFVLGLLSGPALSTPPQGEGEKPPQGAVASPGGGTAEAEKEDPGFLRGLEDDVDSAMGNVVGLIAEVLFFDLIAWDNHRVERWEVKPVPDAFETWEVRDREGTDVFTVSFDEVTKVLSLVDASRAPKLKIEPNAIFGSLTVGVPADEEEFTFRVKAGNLGITDHDDKNVPAIVLWLVIGALVFTFWMKFVNLRAFGHAIQVVRGKYDNPSELGEVTHFQALSSALSATVGLGNIAGVAIAVSIGGPGATFWMIVAGLLGMSTKFTECTLGQMYRKVDADSHISGGPMRYLRSGLAEMGMGGLGAVLAYAFAILCVLASFGGGNMFQVKQSLGAIQETVSSMGGIDKEILREWNFVYGLVMALLVGVVIIGGIKRIAQTAEKIVPLMCGIYVLAALWIIVQNFEEVPEAFGTIFGGAFSPEAFRGGFIGVLIQGFRRAAFSNEAGVGSAAIAHSAAKTEEPVREGVVALLEPFIDTVVVCTMTALVIVITGAYSNPEGSFLAARATEEGAALTSLAFEKNISWFPALLGVAVLLFAFSTMISWSYYGERCFTFIFGEKASTPYKVIFCFFVFLGSIVSATNILDFSDLMILAMAVPNLLGAYLLAPKVKRALDGYLGKLRAGEFKTFK